jgi:LacI family transcriptional regulator
MTILEVANKAGVSTATVSRMINENGFVSDEARKKILQAMKEVGYNPARRKRRLSNSSSPLKYRNVAMIWTTGRETQLSSTGQDLMLGITAGLRQMNASLTVDHIDSSGYIPQTILTGAIDGIFIHGPTPADAVCQYLKKFPVVWLLQQGSVEFGDRVQPDHAFAAELACNYLTEQGCQTLCCISDTPSKDYFKYVKTRTDSFINLAAVNNIHARLLEHPELPSAEATPPVLSSIAAKLVDSFAQLNPRPDGLFVANNLGPYIHNELVKQGIIPMKDVLMVAGDANICSQQHLVPAPVTIRIFSQRIGKQAVETLLLRIKNPDMPQTTCFLKPQLIIPG